MAQVDNMKLENSNVSLTEERIVMLKLSGKDIKNGRLIPQNQSDKEELKWLKGL
jgi:hypothetical protein